MNDERSKEIEGLVAGMRCPRNFRCKESRLKPISRQTGFRVETYFLCEEEAPHSCGFAEPFGARPYGYFCRCPTRLALFQKLQETGPKEEK